MSRLDKRTVFADLMTAHQSEDLTPDAFMVAGFGNTTVVATREGLVVIDVPARSSQKMLEAIRRKTDAPISTVIYTHIHADHAFTAQTILDDAKKRGYRRPVVIAQANSLAHFARYREMQAYTWYINQIQAGSGFRKPTGQEKFLPDDIVYPDITYTESMSFKSGDVTFELRHYMGETDDGTWVWIPELKIAVVGDLLEGDCPNIGNPFKVQRYEVEWAEALEAIAGKKPEVLVPGHGPVRRGNKVAEWCLDTARYLRFFHREVVRLLNEGYWLEDILHMVKPPEEFAGKRFLSGIYGCPAFMIHGIHRRYAGWYNGNASELFPSRSADIASEVMHLVEPEKVMERALELERKGEVQLALHLVDFIIKGASKKDIKKKALLRKSALLDTLSEAQTNQIARNIMLSGAEEAEHMAKTL